MLYFSQQENRFDESDLIRVNANSSICRDYEKKQQAAIKIISYIILSGIPERLELRSDCDAANWGAGLSSHLVHHIRKQTSNLACLAKGANDNFTALHKKLLEVANED